MTLLLSKKYSLLLLLQLQLQLLLSTFGDSSSSPVILSYECPDDAIITTAATDESIEKTGSWNTRTDYGSLDNEILTDLDEYLKTFRDATFDTYHHTYNEYKDHMRPFKAKYYTKYFKKPGATTLYESANGIGLNLLVTLEILQENGIDGITVYGNEYVDASTKKARHVLNALLPTMGGNNNNNNNRVGTICTGDSTDLKSFVPSNSFDVVYSGYISPMINPLEFTLTQDENFAWYRKLCEAKEGESPPDYLKWRDAAQQIQNDWFGKWVGEMVRIAKPGSAVIIEQVAVPYCDCYIDWGGVPQSFWKEAIEKNTYNWNIEPTSLVIELDTMHEKRYHVVMEKKKKNETEEKENDDDEEAAAEL